MTDQGQGVPILQTTLPHTPWDDPALSRMPGLKPVTGHWIVVDDAYAPQMTERERLLRSLRDDVLQTCNGSEAAQAELLAIVLDDLPGSFSRDGDMVVRPDGVGASLKGEPLLVLGHLLQEDLLLLDLQGDEHVLVAGLLCFPASWTLGEKMGRPLTRIHRPVHEYDRQLAGQVQRLFDRMPVSRAMWRANMLGYAEPDLHQPKSEVAPRSTSRPPRYLRSERQTVLRLPQTGAILFAVHTWVVALENLTSQQAASCPIN